MRLGQPHSVILIGAGRRKIFALLGADGQPARGEMIVEEPGPFGLLRSPLQLNASRLAAAKKLLASGRTSISVARSLGISRDTLYRSLIRAQ